MTDSSPQPSPPDSAPTVPSATATKPYHPESRRPIADSFRQTARWTTQFCVVHNIHPDVISYLSVVAAALGGLGFWLSGRIPALLLIAPLFCYVRLWMNMLDGMVALAAGKASWRGEILNDLPDRISDVLIFVGVAHSGWCAPASGYWSAIMALLVAYVGTFGQAVGAGRQFGGIMSKPWRMVTLHLGAWLTFLLLVLHAGNRSFLGLTVLDWTAVAIVAGGIQSMAARLSRIFDVLKTRG